ncbi:MAG: hypothetical protein ACLUD2_05280 [Clostridium sp.]
MRPCIPAPVFAEAAEPERVGGLSETSYRSTPGMRALAGLDENTADYTAKELEAKLIAAKIRR